MAKAAPVDPFNVRDEEDSTDEELDSSYACTVINLVPLDISEPKPHMLPSVFNIKAAAKDDFTILHVKEGIHYIANPLIDEGKPGSSIKQTTLPSEMARSICEDYISAHICRGDKAQPGLFWVPGRLSKGDIRRRHADKLEKAREEQNNWFRRLIALADADWEKNHNMLAVSDLQRCAARQLGIQKDWVEIRVQETKPCPFCTTAVPPTAVKCPNCHEVVNAEEYAKLKSKMEGTV